MFRHPIFWLVLTISLGISIATRPLFSQRSDLYRYSKDLPEILNLVDRAYVDEVDMQTLMPGVFQGTLEAVDLNASYIPPGIEPKDWTETLFNRTGLVIAKQFGQIFVVSLAEGSAAHQAGLLRGSFIRRINKQPTRDMSIFKARRLLAQADPHCDLTVIHKTKDEEQSLTLQPTSFSPTPPTLDTYDDGLVVLVLSHFTADTQTQLDHAIKAARQSGGKLLIDLRNNALGEEAHLRLLASYFLPVGTSGSWTNAKHESVKILNPKKPKWPNAPLYLLVDHSTSRSAEYFAALAQEAGVTTIIGGESLALMEKYRFIPLKNGAHIQISTQLFQLNSGTPFKNGVKPDLKLDFAKRLPEDILNLALEKVRNHQISEKKAS